jgi:hypothetical protein
MRASISRVSVTDFSQFDDSVSVLFGATVSHECRTTDHESKCVLLTIFRLGLLALRANGPKEARSSVDQNLYDVLMRNLPLRLSSASRSIWCVNRTE